MPLPPALTPLVLTEAASHTSSTQQSAPKLLITKTPLVNHDALNIPVEDDADDQEPAKPLVLLAMEQDQGCGNLSTRVTPSPQKEDQRE